MQTLIGLVKRVTFHNSDFTRAKLPYTVARSGCFALNSDIWAFGTDFRKLTCPPATCSNKAGLRPVAAMHFSDGKKIPGRHTVIIAVDCRPAPKPLVYYAIATLSRCRASAVARPTLDKAQDGLPSQSGGLIGRLVDMMSSSLRSVATCRKILTHRSR